MQELLELVFPTGLPAKAAKEATDLLEKTG
jgi:hypothetical protein